MKYLKNQIKPTLKIMRKSILIIAVAILFSTSLTSCGVMFGGSKYRGTIVAKNHPNADIYVDGQKIGIGTTTNLFARNKPLVVTLEEKGCKPQTLTFNKSFRTGNFILSAISWGFIGMGVDLGTGASFKPDHKGNPAIQKLSTKNFTFNVEYSKCEKPE